MVREKIYFVTERKPHFVEILLPFFMLLAQYKIGPFCVSYELLMIVAAFTYLRNSNIIRLQLKYWPYFIFLLYVVVCDIFRAMLGPDSMQTELNRMMEYVVVFFLVLIVSSQPFDEEKLYKYWKIAGVFFSIGLFYQLLQIYVLHQRIAPISLIPGYQLRPDDTINILRPSSFFSEPAAFTGSILPLLFLSLKRSDFKWAIFCTISILLSTSTVGVILSIVLWLSMIVIHNISVNNKIIVFLIVISFIWVLMSTDVFSITQSKFLAVVDGGSTFNSRVANGFVLIGNMPASDWIFGTRYSDVGRYITDNLDYFAGCDALLVYWKLQALFLNNICSYIFRYGVVGLGLFLLPLIIYLRKKNYSAKSYIIMVIVAMFGQAMVLNAYYFLIVMICMLYDNLNGSEKIIDKRRANNE